MKIYAINGGPRKTWNTVKMLESFLDGAKSLGAEVEIIHLYDLEYSSCRECYGCKLKNSNNYGRCIFPDELKPILNKLYEADGVILGSPIYFGEITGQLRAFLERWFFPFDSHKKGETSLAPKEIPTAIIYTMNETENNMNKFHYLENVSTTHLYLHALLGYKPDIIYACNTYEFDDYNKYEASYWNEEEKRKYHKNHFPKDLNNAYEAGKKMTIKIMEKKK